MDLYCLNKDFINKYKFAFYGKKQQKPQGVFRRRRKLRIIQAIIFPKISALNLFTAPPLPKKSSIFREPFYSPAPPSAQMMRFLKLVNST